LNEGDLFPPGPLVVTETAPGIGSTDSGCISIAAFTQNAGGGFKVPYDRVVYILEFSNGGAPGTDPSLQGTICVDTCTPSGGGAWSWVFLVGGSWFPTFYDAPLCFPVANPPNLPPVPDCGDPNATFSHCETATLDFSATDPDGDPLTWSASVGTMTPVAGNASTWSWNGGPQEGFVTLTVTVTDNFSNSANCVVELEFTNEGPSIVCSPTVPTVLVNDTKCVNVTVDDDCDVLTLSTNPVDAEIAITPLGGGVYSICYSPTAGPAGVRTFEVIVDDGLATASCDVSFNVIEGAPYGVVIEKIHDQIQGQFVDVALTLLGVDPAQGIGGFDLLIAYDNSALSFQQALEGDIYAQCGWEYFTYRFGADGNCGGGCPSGLTRVVGLAETNNGADHPTCNDPDFVGPLPTTLAYLRFLVSNDRTLECQYVPIRFFWVDCGDNTISNGDGSELYISGQVFDYDNDAPINDGSFGFPGYLGAADFCLEQGLPGKPVPIRYIDFYNGGVDIVCADSIDARGDINLNGLSYEIADAVMFTNYFITGLGAFEFVQGSIAASDVNADGIPLSVADLVYLIRVIVGDALPYPKLNPMHATYAMESNVMSVDAEMGAAYLVFEGKVNADLLADNMDMKVGLVDGNTHVLVFSTNANQVFSGNFLNVDGNLVSAEFATYDGQPVAAKNVPRTFRVEQNYPNPFNPNTVIEFAMPNAGAWSVEIFNVTGQRVDSFNGVAEAGVVSVNWNASELASGVYFYRVAAGQNSKTMKAVLLK
jgi:hypothetical protein